MTAIEKIQTVLFDEGLYTGAIDNLWGSQSQAALNALLSPASATGVHHVTATSFADENDLRAYHNAIAEGRSQYYALSVGDNGVGEWKDSTIEGTGLGCALPPHEIRAKWGTLDAGHLKPVNITMAGITVTAILKDILPDSAVRVDCTPDTVTALGQTCPMEVPATWAWA